MGTEATWHLWVGIRYEHLIDDTATEEGVRVMTLLQKQGEYRLFDDVILEEIYMHGECVGIGVRILELDWDVALGTKNVFPLHDVRQGTVHLATLDRVFSEWRIGGRIAIYHHLDLGG